MPLPRRIDRLWKFVGSEVLDKSDLAPHHIRAAYGLGSQASQEQDEAGQRSQPAPFPYCGNKYEHLPESPNSKPEQTGAKCSAAKCRDNPNCLNHLGQEHWESEGAFEYYRSIRSLGTTDSKLVRRDAGLPVGLKNLGATCYASSLLQCWFQDYDFRNTIFRCQHSEDGQQLESKPLYQLQLLFGFMDSGIQSVYNPESLVKVLRLDTGIQQDAQEFYSLFLSLLDRQFEIQDDQAIREFVKEHFRGHYSYKTKCSKCGTEKKQRCAFYDIMVNIKDNCTLTDCLDEFIEAEELTGSDRYQCSVCDSLQVATRSIQFEELPEVLNISLMRYRYDKETWIKRKSFDMVRFPEVIDFSEYLDEAPDKAKGEHLYDLTAVLVHSGTSAYSGHYMANVWNPALSQWTLLNDEQVQVFDKDTIFDPDAYTGFDTNTPKKPKVASKTTRADAEKKLQTISTKNAYLLTYTRRKSPESRALPIPPPARVMDEVKNQNDKFEEEMVKEQQRIRDLQEQFEAERKALRDIYQHWHVSGDQEPCYYTTASSLEKFIENPTSTPLPTEEIIGMANAIISCEHGKLCPMSITKAKRINKAAGLKLLNDRMDIMSPILTENDLCEPCVSRNTQEMLYSTQHRKDTEEYERKSKSSRSPPAVWVSKAWLNEWLKRSPKFLQSNQGGTVQDDPSPLSDEYISDVFCPHGNLATDKTKRKLVNKSALEILKRLFGELNLPSNDSEECAMCMEDQMEDTESKQRLVDMAANERKELPGIVMRGLSAPNRNSGDKFYVISKDFLRLWLAFVKRPTVAERPAFYDNSQLLCEHEGLLYDVLCEEDIQDADGVAFLREEEWAFLSAIYEGGPEIFFFEPSHTEDGGAAREPVVSSHQVCAGCRQARQLNYETVEITIRMMTKADQSQIGDEARNVSERGGTSAAAAADETSKKRPEPAHIYSRRSKRVKKTNGSSTSSANSIKSIKIFIHKTDTVMDLKLKIMQKVDIVPLYQQLLWNKVELDNNEATMGSLGILPRSTLDMIIFEENGTQLDFMQLDDVVPVEPTCPMELG